MGNRTGKRITTKNIFILNKSNFDGVTIKPKESIKARWEFIWPKFVLLMKDYLKFPQVKRKVGDYQITYYFNNATLNKKSVGILEILNAKAEIDLLFIVDKETKKPSMFKLQYPYMLYDVKETTLKLEVNTKADNTIDVKEIKNRRKKRKYTDNTMIMDTLLDLDKKDIDELYKIGTTLTNFVKRSNQTAS